MKMKKYRFMVLCLTMSLVYPLLTKRTETGKDHKAKNCIDITYHDLRTGGDGYCYHLCFEQNGFVDKLCGRHCSEYVSCLKAEKEAAHNNQGDGRKNDNQNFTTSAIAGIISAIVVVVVMLPIGTGYLIISYRKRNNINPIPNESQASIVGAPSVSGPNHQGNAMLPSGFPPVAIGEEGLELLETIV